MNKYQEALNEMYEGDIVKIEDYYSNDDYLFVIEFDEYCFIANEKRAWLEKDLRHIDIAYVEVVGNIYDDKELLQ